MRVNRVAEIASISKGQDDLKVPTICKKMLKSDINTEENIEKKHTNPPFFRVVGLQRGQKS